jgi:hypothetical protein
VALNSVIAGQGLAQVQRQVIGWFEVSDHDAFSTENFPVFILEDEELGEFYGFPEFDGLPGMKIGKFYHLYEACEEPDNLSRVITSADEEVRDTSNYIYIYIYIT